MKTWFHARVLVVVATVIWITAARSAHAAAPNEPDPAWFIELRTTQLGSGDTGKVPIFPTAPLVGTLVDRSNPDSLGNRHLDLEDTRANELVVGVQERTFTVAISAMQKQITLDTMNWQGQSRHVIAGLRLRTARVSLLGDPVALVDAIRKRSRSIPRRLFRFDVGPTLGWARSDAVDIAHPGHDDEGVVAIRGQAGIVAGAEVRCDFWLTHHLRLTGDAAFMAMSHAATLAAVRTAPGSIYSSASLPYGPEYASWGVAWIF